MTIQETNQDLSQKAVNIKGKKYVLVSDRVLAFNELYPKGSITTELVSTPDSQRIIIKAMASPDGTRLFNGYASETIGKGFINTTSALENAETSAVGRALAMMGIGVLDSIASADEVNKAIRSENQNTQNEPINPKVVSQNLSDPQNATQGNFEPRGVKEKLGSCPHCGADMAHNPKTGKNFCSAKCWLK